MDNDSRNLRRGRGIGWTLLAVTACMLTTVGCENHGKLQPDRDVTSAFQNQTLPGDYAYYYYGPDNMPYAIAGIGRPFSLQTKLWHAVDHRSDRFAEMVKWVWTDHNYTPQGAYILGPKRERIGIWYSSISRAAIDVNMSGMTVVIAPDKPFLRDGPGR